MDLSEKEQKYIKQAMDILGCTKTGNREILNCYSTKLYININSDPILAEDYLKYEFCMKILIDDSIYASREINRLLFNQDENSEITINELFSEKNVLERARLENKEKTPLNEAEYLKSIVNEFGDIALKSIDFADAYQTITQLMLEKNESVYGKGTVYNLFDDFIKNTNDTTFHRELLYLQKQLFKERIKRVADIFEEDGKKQLFYETINYLGVKNPWDQVEVYGAWGKKLKEIHEQDLDNGHKLVEYQKAQFCHKALSNFPNNVHSTIFNAENNTLGELYNIDKIRDYFNSNESLIATHINFDAFITKKVDEFSNFGEIGEYFGKIFSDLYELQKKQLGGIGEGFISFYSLSSEFNNYIFKAANDGIEAALKEISSIRFLPKSPENLEEYGIENRIEKDVKLTPEQSEFALSAAYALGIKDVNNISVIQGWGDKINKTYNKTKNTTPYGKLAEYQKYEFCKELLYDFPENLLTYTAKHGTPNIEEMFSVSSIMAKVTREHDLQYEADSSRLREEMGKLIAKYEPLAEKGYIFGEYYETLEVAKKIGALDFSKTKIKDTFETTITHPKEEQLRDHLELLRNNVLANKKFPELIKNEAIDILGVANIKNKLSIIDVWSKKTVEVFNSALQPRQKLAEYEQLLFCRDLLLYSPEQDKSLSERISPFISIQDRFTEFSVDVYRKKYRKDEPNGLNFHNKIAENSGVITELFFALYVENKVSVDAKTSKETILLKTGKDLNNAIEENWYDPDKILDIINETNRKIATKDNYKAAKEDSLKELSASNKSPITGNLTNLIETSKALSELNKAHPIFSN